MKIQSSTPPISMKVRRSLVSPQNISGASQQIRVAAFCITHYEPPRALRSSGPGLLSVPRVRTKHGEAAFGYYEQTP